MGKIPEGTFDAARIAEELYERPERESYFAAARERFPDWNGDQDLDAMDYIMERFQEDFGDRYSDEEWDRLSQPLSEAVLGGLT